MSVGNRHAPVRLKGGSRVGIVFNKEFREIFRDKRTVFSVVISPLLMTPLMLWVMGTMVMGQQASAKRTILPITVVASENAPQIEQALRANPGFRVESVPESEVEARIKDRRLQAALVLPKGASALIEAQQSVPVKVLFDAGRDSSRDASGRIHQTLDAYAKTLVQTRLKEKGLHSEFAEPFKTADVPITGGGTMATLILASLLPYTLAIAAFAGGIYAANDQVAGEKERGTLETLLITPASRRDIVLGKFLAVAAVCLMSSLLSIVGLMLPFFTGLKGFEWLSKGGISLSPTAIAVTLIMQLPLAVLFAGILLAISTFARNQKEAQTYLAPMFIVVLMPAMMSMMIRTEAAKSLALIPILNSTLIVKQALSNTFDPAFIAIAFAASVVYAAIALVFATRLFHKEEVLIKT